MVEILVARSHDARHGCLVLVCSSTHSAIDIIGAQVVALAKELAQPQAQPDLVGQVFQLVVRHVQLAQVDP